MSLKTYQARSMSEALRQVKDELGSDAVILHTRTYKRGGVWGWGGRRMVEITAAHATRVRAAGSARPAGAGRPAPSRAESVRGAAARPVARGVEPAADAARAVESVRAGEASRGSAGGEVEALRRELGAVRAELGTVLREARAARQPSAPTALLETWTTLIGNQVSEAVAAELLSEALAGPADAAAVRAALARRIAALAPAAGAIEYGALGQPRVVALVGPTGMGKTTTLAKLAANAKLRDGRRVGLITLDTYRIAAVEQLRTYAAILEIPLVVVSTPDEMSRALAELADRELILIDTAGRSPNDAARLAELRALLSAARPDETHLVVSSTLGESAAVTAAERFGALGADRLLVTKLDEAVGFGVVLSVLKKVTLRLSYVTNGQNVPHDISVASAETLAESLMGRGAGTAVVA